MHFLIIGVGSIGERHLRNFLRIDGVRCAVAEVNQTTRERIAAGYDVTHTYEDYREADLSAFDGVVICVPANLHVPIATEVVRSGTHVLTEKPLAMSLDGVQELKQLRDEKGVIVSVAFTMRTDPLIREMKERIDTEDSGAVRVVTYQAGQYWPRMRKDYPPQYAQRRETGGGAIPDHLVHVINYLEWFFGPPMEVAARQWSLGLRDINTEDTAHVVLRFAHDVIATLSICLFQQDSNLSLQIVADNGTLRLGLGSDTLELYDGAGSQWRRGREQSLDRDDVFLRQAQHFVDCIRGDAAPRCTLEQAEQTLRTVLAALESSDGDGRFVRVQQPRL